MINRVAFLVLVILLTVVGGGLSFGCFSSEEDIFYVAGIPDQNVGELTRQYDRFTEKLGEELGVTVKYVPTIDYAATVLAFARGDVHLAWFGGLTGVQARILVPGSIAIAQRARDAEFHSVFIHNTSVEVKNLSDLQGLRFSFGDENSTSGHLMPRHFLLEAGINADVYFDGAPMYSGSHDKTWLLVQGGGAQAGALSESSRSYSAPLRRSLQIGRLRSTSSNREAQLAGVGLTLEDSPQVALQQCLNKAHSTSSLLLLVYRLTVRQKVITASTPRVRRKVHLPEGNLLCA